MNATLRPERRFSPHLVISQVNLSPAGEWSPQQPGWCFLQASAGLGYWMHPSGARELVTGAAAVLSQAGPGHFRASQLGVVTLHWFRLDPELLTGLASLEEQQFFRSAAVRERFALRILPPTDAGAERFGKLCAAAAASTIRVRVQLLQLLLESLGADFKPEETHSKPELDAKQRLAQWLKSSAAAELSEMDFSELAQTLHCTPRHLSRIFRELVGTSFREKQTELRLTRAGELLATSRSKVVEVALESGYQSQSLFNLLFKRRFGLSPARWRHQQSLKARRHPHPARLAVV